MSFHSIVVLAFSTLAACACCAAPPASYRVYIGTSGAKAKGIYLFNFDSASGSLASAGLAVNASNPGFLAISADKKFLYATGDMPSSGKKIGAVSTFSIDPATGKLTLLNQQPSGGAGPCHVSLDPSGGPLLCCPNF